LTLWLNEPYLRAKGGYGHDQTHVVGDTSGGVQPSLGLRNEIARPVIAWLVLLACGISAALTGQLDWTFLGHPVAGERFPFAAGLGISSFALWMLGDRSGSERRACWFTLATAALAFVLAPISFEHLSAGWWTYQTPVWLGHVGLCAQLLAWSAAARKPQKLGLRIMAAGLACEAFVILPVAWFVDVDAACKAGMAMTCATGSATVALALPAAVTLALVFLWLNPIETAVRGRFSE
jgi:hypothetical protein